MAFNFSNKKRASLSDWLVLATDKDKTVLVSVASTKRKALNRMVRFKRRGSHRDYSVWEARLALTMERET